jgi:glucokinase
VHLHSKKEELIMADVFISYAREDQKYAEKLANILRGGDLSVWWDRGLSKGDSGLTPGDDFRKKIADELEASKCVVVLWSKQAVESDWVPNEASMALKLGVYIGARIEDTELPIEFQGRQTADLRGWTGNISHDGLNDLGKGIENTIRNRDRQLADKKPPLGSIKVNVSVRTPLSLRENSDCLSIGVHVGTTRIAAGIIKIARDLTLEYWPSNIVRMEHDAITNSQGIRDKIISVIDELKRKEGVANNQIKGIGIALPGQVNRTNGFLDFAPGLQIRGFNFCKQLHEYYGVPVHADNDINCATFAELTYGCGERFNDFVCIFFGTGIGAGIVINKNIVRGHNYSAGEIGHMKIDYHSNARECMCGGKGCFEEYASARGMIRQARVKMFDVIDRKINSDLKNLDPRTINPKEIVKLINKGDPEAKGLANDIAGYISMGLANIANILNPQALVLGGGIIEGFYDFPDFHGKIIAGFKDHAIDACQKVDLIETSFIRSDKGRMAPIVGASLLPFEKEFF